MLLGQCGGFDLLLRSYVVEYVAAQMMAHSELDLESTPVTISQTVL